MRPFLVAVFCRTADGDYSAATALWDTRALPYAVDQLVLGLLAEFGPLHGMWWSRVGELPPL